MANTMLSAISRDTNLDIRAKRHQYLFRRGSILQYFHTRIDHDGYPQLLEDEALSANGDIKNDFAFVLRYGGEQTAFFRDCLRKVYGTDDFDDAFKNRSLNSQPTSTSASHGNRVNSCLGMLTQSLSDMRTDPASLPKKLIDSADMLAILNARGTVMLNQHFTPAGLRLKVIKLATFALQLWAELSIDHKNQPHDAIVIHHANIERTILMVRDDIQNHLLDASKTFDFHHWPAQLNHFAVLLESVETWQKMVAKRTFDNNENSVFWLQNYRDMGNDALKYDTRSLALDEMLQEWPCLNSDHGSEWMGPLLRDEKDRTRPGKITFPGVRRNQDSFWFNA